MCSFTDEFHKNLLLRCRRVEFPLVYASYDEGSKGFT